MSEETFAHLACPNPDCPAYGQRGAGNLHPHGWSGRGHRIRCLRCTTCGKDFSQRANTPLRFTARFGKHAERFHDHMVRGVQPRQIQPDEAWAFVGKKRQEL